MVKPVALYQDTRPVWSQFDSELDPEHKELKSIKKMLILKTKGVDVSADLWRSIDDSGGVKTEEV